MHPIKICVVSHLDLWLPPRFIIEKSSYNEAIAPFHLSQLSYGGPCICDSEMITNWKSS